ncbi:MAG: DUF433 domain-containing protein [Caldilinea sp.]|nr:DUF433 domain-containing protein [Caldilinea sp.]
MARYALNLPEQLKQQAESWARQQGISLNQFILWATAEKVGALNQQLDDPRFPQITYRRGASGAISPVLRGTGIRVQTIVVANERWEQPPAEIAAAYDISERQVSEALGFYAAHRSEIEQAMMAEVRMEDEQTTSAS